MAHSAHWSPRDTQEAYTQLLRLSGVGKPGMKEKSKQRPDVWGSVPAHAVSAIILDELSRTFSSICNFIPEVELLKEGRLHEAYVGVLAKVDGITVVDPVSAWVKAQAKASVSKLSIPELRPIVPTAKQWWSDERACSRTNQRLVAYRKRHLDGVKPLPWGREFQRMVEFCHYVLGDSPDLPAVLGSTRYGPGSSVGVSGDSTHYATKVLAWDCTQTAVSLAVDALALDKGAWEVIGFDPRESTNLHAIEGFKREARRLVVDNIVSSEKLLFIFKNAKAMRSIGVQPTLSGMIQLGIDSVMKSLLKSRANIDLSDQTLNQRLAWDGSKNWQSANPWCTLDKSSASNLIAKLLPGFVFPREWSKLLWSTRTPMYDAPPELGGGTHAYEMYAGMGNGTTFAVESLIFAGIAYAVSDISEPADCLKKRTFSVYGDDVILRRDCADNYMRFAEYLGFRMNHDKSFTEGPFRESCGADYWAGVNIRPAYVNGENALNELELVGVHNTIMDSPIFCMLNAAKRLRALWKKAFPWPVPSDPQGGLGFRTASNVAWEYVGKDGQPTLSPVWFRPRGYTISVNSKMDRQEDSGSYVSLMIALQRGSQERSGDQLLSLPFRNAVKIRVVPEQDLIREDLVTMLRNQLSRLALYKQSPWWKPSRGK